MFQFHIKQFGLMGDGSGVSLGYQLILRVVGVAEASPKNVWLADYYNATLSTALTAAKAGGAGLFATSTVTPWVDTPATGVAESLSAVFTPTF